MTRISLQTLDAVQQLQQRSLQQGQMGGALARLAPGQILRAEVVQNLGNGLFSLNIQGNQVVSASSTPLTVGQVLTLQVSTTDGGQPTMHVLTLAEGAVAATGGGNQAGVAENGQLADIVAQRQALGIDTPRVGAQAQSGVQTRGQPATAEPAVLTDLRALVGQVAEQSASETASRVDPRLSGLLRSDGPVARLLTQRPDLAPRIEQLLTQLRQRPDGLGTGLDKLASELARLTRNVEPAQRPALAGAQTRLTSQILGRELFDQPKLLAQALGNRLEQLARGLEASVARQLTPNAAVPTGTATVANTAAPASSAPTVVVLGTLEGTSTVVTANTSTPGAVAAPDTAGAAAASVATEPGQPNVTAQSASDARPIVATTTEGAAGKPADTALGAQMREGEPSATPTAETRAAAPPAASREVIQGTFDGDLKGQLLQLKTQLQDLAASQPRPDAAIQQAIARTDVLLDQVTAQQVHNLDGLNHYAHVELPVDPRSGIGEARLQVFYRKNQRSKGAEDSDRFTLALFLNMTRLGDVLAVVTVVDEAISVAFTVQDRQVERIMSHGAQSLRDALMEAGHSGATVTVRKAMPRPATEPSAADGLWREFIEPPPCEGESGYHLNTRA